MNPPNIPDCMYHYCSLDVFEKIIEASTLRMTNIIKSNDYTEITFCLDEFVDAFYQALTRLKGNIYDSAFQEFLTSVNIEKIVERSIKNKWRTYYATCFSREGDLLSQWRGYANDGKGVALGFYTEPFCSCGGPATWKLCPVYYNISQVKEDLVAYIEQKIARPSTFTQRTPYIADYENAVYNIIDRIVYDAPFYKNPAFAEEQEIRFVYYPFGRIRDLFIRHATDEMVANQLFYDHMQDALLSEDTVNDFQRMPASFYVRDNMIVSFVNLNFEKRKHHILKEIVIGPKANINDLDLRLFLLKHGYDLSQIAIYNSKASYR